MIAPFRMYAQTVADNPIVRTALDEMLEGLGEFESVFYVGCRDKNFDMAENKDIFARMVFDNR